MIKLIAKTRQKQATTVKMPEHVFVFVCVCVFVHACDINRINANWIVRMRNLPIIHSIWWWKLVDWCSHSVSGTTFTFYRWIYVDFYSFHCIFTSFRFATCIYQFQKWEMRLQMKTDRMPRLSPNQSVCRMEKKKIMEMHSHCNL